ncbi:MAG TPA: hypothetical protein VEK15_01340 [Vicinamibacteria bacterium]|nr:hypothetical protein [Vicinamibacteria bacterium]
MENELKSRAPEHGRPRDPGREVEKALDTCRSALEQPANPEILDYAPYIYVRCGERGKAQDIFDTLSSFAESAYVDPYYLACAHAALGEIDAAFD